MRKTLGLLFLLFTGVLQAQSVLSFERSLNWQEAPAQIESAGGETFEVWSFDQCSRSDLAPTLPFFNERFALNGRSTLTAVLLDAQYAPIALNLAPEGALIGDQVNVQVRLEQERNQYFARVRFFPIRKNGQSYEKLVSFTLNIQVKPLPTAVVDRGGNNTYNSALSSGSVYKFGVSQSGVYKLDYNYLKSELGISNLDNLDPHSIRLFGNGGAMLPETTDSPRPDDLLENAIVVVGEEDGKFNTNDYILFYAVGPAPIVYKPSTTDPQLSISNNLYDAKAWYFIKTGDGNGARVQSRASIDGAYLSESFDDVQRLEDDQINLLDLATSAQGSGKRWFGDYFLQTRSKTYSFNFPNIIPDSSGRIRAEFAGRSGTSTAFRINIAGSQFIRNVPSVTLSNPETNYAANAAIAGRFVPNQERLDVLLEYPQVSQSSEGWLDYIEINVRRKLQMDGSTLLFRDLKTIGQGSANFKITAVNGALKVWDVTNPQQAVLQQTSGSTSVSFGIVVDTLHTFYAFYENTAFPKPETTVGLIPNQNIHAFDHLDMAIVYHADLEAQALQLAEHRRTYSGLSVAAVNVDQLYNEFSSGGKDPSAIRDFARMLLSRDARFDYLLLMGDGSFDPKNNSKGVGNIDLIPVFETQESFHPIYAYPSDDYFALLSDGEGGALEGALDIAVGRITARDASEAQAVVDKIMAYDQSATTLGDWHLRLLYLADDEDNNAHVKQADKLSVAAENKEEWFNVDKIYFDAYRQVATIGDDRFPDATSAINSNVFKGALILQYIGHGGPRGWAQERVITNNDIAQWNNSNRYPLIITATCSFGGYDDYKTVTGGEQSLLKSQSGAVGLFTTVRAVFIDGNNLLTDAVQSVIFQRVNGQYRSIGDILKDGKNKLSGGTEDNARRFTLLGDPAMFLALPEYRVATTSINGHPAGSGQPDTLRALMPVEIEGMVTDTAGNIQPNFNGKVTVTLYDKKQTLQTLGQDSNSPIFNFGLRRNILFKGSATVSNGRFKINFVTPRDINYSYGFGKISYYAENGTHLDAAGADESIVVGGNANAIQDDQPPVVQVFLNTDAFVSGGITNDNPKILVKCADDFGMNVTGVSLGHDLTVVLDDNQLEAITLNDFYESEQDNFRKGQALYPLQNLSVGKHTLRAKGWDIANNSSEGYTEFIVAENGANALAHVLNYPNPFTTNTYFQFEHNFSANVLEVQVSIFSVSGKLVKTIVQAVDSDGFRVDDLAWDGRDEYGDPLARGVYVYRVKVRGADDAGTIQNAESGFEKLVILK